ncbi:MAG: phosphopyruvate hydratase [Candidatus Thermoplasmatota archaeon]|nr:phosphopyruvate hydratase [Candidatus Thermoplasmatota archaeon]
MKRIIFEQVRARQIFDSRGNPTIQAYTGDGEITTTASVPSGASTGRHEALELRDGGIEFGGKGVNRAIENVEGPIASSLIHRSFADVREVDLTMIKLDGTPNKSALGANAILSVSMAAARLFSRKNGLELFEYISSVSGRRPSIPVPMLNIINGGVHAGGELAVQEFLIVPSGFKNIFDALRASSEIYQSLKAHLKRKYGPFASNIGDEGGFVPPVKKTEDALQSIVESVTEAGYSPGTDVFLAIDAAASEFYRDGIYVIDGKEMEPAELGDYYISLASKFPIVSIEDPYDEEAFEDFAILNKRIGSKVQLIGDDIYVTNSARIRRGIEMKSSNAVLIKLNQIGTVSETVDSSLLAVNAGMNAVVSHRSGETTDDFIADLAVGLGTGQIKTGAPARGERVAKYNRLMEIASGHPDIPFSSVVFFGRK